MKKAYNCLYFDIFFTQNRVPKIEIRGPERAKNGPKTPKMIQMTQIDQIWPFLIGL